MMEEKAQVNIEYLLIIAGAVAVVTVVSLYVKTSANTAAQTAQQQIEQNP
ncbi:MAG: hypothetical protein WC462_01025 [archaeon]